MELQRQALWFTTKLSTSDDETLVGAGSVVVQITLFSIIVIDLKLDGSDYISTIIQFNNLNC
jgi:hypothetical protein